MFDYIQIYEKYSQFGSYIIPAKDRLICSALGAIVFVIVWHILRDKIVDGLLVLSSLLLTAVFAFGYFSLFASPENSENLAQVKV